MARTKKFQPESNSENKQTFIDTSAKDALEEAKANPNIRWIGNLGRKTPEWTRTFMDGDYFPAKVCGAKVEQVDGHDVICSMEITPKLYNVWPEVMGGAIFTLGDFATAAADILPDMTGTTIDGHIQYLAPAEGNILFAYVKCKHYGYSIAYYDVDFITDGDRSVAHGSYTYCHIHPKQ